MITKAFLSALGLAYLGLAVWCGISPTKTAGSIGFQLQPGSGQSEYLTVYGGLQFALGLMFLWPLVRESDTRLVLAACVLLHACLVIARTISFARFSGISGLTYGLAVGEWIILLISAGLLWKR